MLFDTSFAISSLLGGFAAGKCDVVVAISPPLQLALTAKLIAKARGARLLLHIQDLVVEAALGAGFLEGNSLPVRLARILERQCYRAADRIGVISEGFRQNLIDKGIRPDKIELLPNYLDLNFMCSQPRVNPFRDHHGVGADKFLVMYSGSVARKQGLQVFVDAAASLYDQRDVALFLIGEGPYLDELKRTAAQRALSNLVFLPLQPREQLPLQLAAADLFVITQRSGVTDSVFPGKLLYYMAAGRPIVAAVSEDSETGRFINRHNVGIVTPPEQPDALARSIAALHSDRARTLEMGNNGRLVAERMFDRIKVLKGFESLLSGLAA